MIAGDLPERAALELDKILQSLSIPLLYVRSYGMIGYLRVSVGTWPGEFAAQAVWSESGNLMAFSVVETHYPKNERRSLYIHPEELKWFPELEKYCSRFDLTFKPDDGDALFARNHIPYIAILVQMGKQWAASVSDLVSWQ